MAIGKNKKAGKSKKGKVKKTDPFLKKEWYIVRSPPVFPTRVIGKTVVTKTIGTKIAKDSLLGRVFEVSLADLKPDTEADAYRKFRLKVEEVSGQNCLTQFNGMCIATDKIRSLVRKWQTLIETHVDVRTTDGFALRLFCIGFTAKRDGQKRKTTYATSTQVKAIRKKMGEIITKEASSVDLNELVGKLTTESMGTEISKHCEAIYPLKDVMIMKCKMLRMPKLDTAKLIEAHGGAQALATLALADKGEKVEEKKDEKMEDKKEEAKKDEKKEEKPKAEKKGKDAKPKEAKDAKPKEEKAKAAEKPAAEKKEGGKKEKKPKA